MRLRIRDWIALACLALLMPWAFRGSIAEAAWKLHLPRVSLALARNSGLAMQIGNHYFNGGAYDLGLAERAYQKAIIISPTTPGAHYQLGRIYLIERRYKQSLEQLNKESEVNPSNVRTFYTRGLVEGFRLDLDAAEADFRRFIAAIPQEWGGYNDLAWILAQEGKYRESERVAELGIERADGGATNPWLWNAKGLAELNLGRDSEAADSFNRASQALLNISEKDWARAYPGNDPGVAPDGLAAFREAVRQNLAAARTK